MHEGFHWVSGRLRTRSRPSKSQYVPLRGICWIRDGQGVCVEQCAGWALAFSSSSATGYYVYPRRPNPNLCRIIGQKQSEARIPQSVFASHSQSQSILTAGAHIADARRRGALKWGNANWGEIRRPPAARALARALSRPRLLVVRVNCRLLPPPNCGQARRGYKSLDR